MKVGDLVMWLGRDKDHGCLGVIVQVSAQKQRRYRYYSVLWYDGITGTEIAPEKLKKVDNESGG